MSLTLQRAKSAYVFDQDSSAEHQHVWPVRVTAVSTSEGLPSAIFVMQRGDAAGGYQGDVFAAVASVSQLGELDTAASAGIPFYRTASVDINCRSPQEAADLWALIREDAIDLFNNWLASTLLVADETVEITSTGPSEEAQAGLVTNQITVVPNAAGNALQYFVNGVSIGFGVLVAEEPA